MLAKVPRKVGVITQALEGLLHQSGVFTNGENDRGWLNAIGGIDGSFAKGGNVLIAELRIKTFGIPAALYLNRKQVCLSCGVSEL